MPLRLNVGLQQKKGLPHYGSLGAACHLELELEASLLERDPEEFHKQVAAAFAICRDAVAEELARQTDESPDQTNGSDRDPQVHDLELFAASAYELSLDHRTLSNRAH